MPDELLKEDFNNLPSQPPGPQPEGAINKAEGQVQFNPSGQVEDIFENTEKPDEKSGQAGFKVKSSGGQNINQEEPPVTEPPAQPVVSKPPPATIPTFSRSSAAISKPKPESLTQDSEYDDEPVTSKKKYFIIGLVGILIIAGALTYWFFVRVPAVELSLEPDSQAQLENFNNNVANSIDPQLPPVTEPDNGDIISNPNPINESSQNLNIDSDQDGLSDEEEAALGTNPMMADSDNDGLFDREEVKVYLTDPNNADTDNDGYLDGEEVVSGFNPNGTGSFLPPIQ